MELLRWKAKLSVLWVFMAVGMSAAMVLGLMMPGEIEEMMAGESEAMMVGYALFWLVPLVMVVLCLTLNRSVNRWLNFILGMLFGLFFIFEVISRQTAGEAMSAAIWLIFIVVLCLPSLNMSMFMLGEEEMEITAETYLIDDMMYMMMDVPEMDSQWMKSSMPEGYWEQMDFTGSQVDLLETA